MSAEAHQSLEAALRILGKRGGDVGDRAVVDAKRELRKLDAALAKHAREYRS